MCRILRPADDKPTKAYRVYVKPTQRSIGAKDVPLSGAHAFEELYISLQIRAGGAGEIVGHAAALVGTEGQADRFAETAEGEVAGVEGTEFRFKGQKNVAGVFEAAEGELPGGLVVHAGVFGGGVGQDAVDGGLKAAGQGLAAADGIAADEGIERGLDEAQAQVGQVVDGVHVVAQLGARPMPVR